jgi:hypothetical protein
MQLDFFNDNHSVILRNDVVHALGRQDAAAAQHALEILQSHYPQDHTLAPAHLLIQALARRSDTALPGHEALASARQAMQVALTPAARTMLGASAEVWLHHRWRELA